MPLTRHERKDLLGHGRIKEIAESLGVNASLVSRVVNGKGRSARVERAIADAIGLPIEKVFPEYHTTPPQHAA